MGVETLCFFFLLNVDGKIIWTHNFNKIWSLYIQQTLKGERGFQDEKRAQTLIVVLRIILLILATTVYLCRETRTCYMHMISRVKNLKLINKFHLTSLIRRVYALLSLSLSCGRVAMQLKPFLQKAENHLKYDLQMCTSSSSLSIL
jgi:hypothetical protein